MEGWDCIPFSDCITSLGAKCAENEGVWEAFPCHGVGREEDVC